MTRSEANAVPNGWVPVTLEDLLDGIEAGKSFECLTRQAAEDEWGVVKVSAMTWGVFDEAENKAVPPAKTVDQRHEIRSGDLLLSRSNTMELVGASVLVRNCRPKLLLSDKSLRLRVVSGIDRAWLQLMLSSPDVRKQLSAVATGSSNSMRNISQDKVMAARLALPPVNEQRRIVAKIEELFSDLDAAVAALERVQAKLKRYRASVLKAAVEGNLTAEWRAQHPNSEPASALLHRILAERRCRWEEAQLARYAKDGKEPPKNWREKYQEPAGPDASTLPPLPEGWCWATVEQLTWFLRNRISQKPAASPPGYRILRINAVRPMAVDIEEVRYMDLPRAEVVAEFVDPGDLLFTRYNESVELLGVVGMVRSLADPTLHPDKLIRVKTVLSSPLPDYLELACNVGESRRHMVSRARTTAGQTGISGADVREMPVPLPSSAEQSELLRLVAERLSVLDAVERQITANLARSARLRQSILKRAFEGWLVPQDPTDEPAEKLLERIRAAADGKRGNRRLPARRGRSEQPTFFEDE